MKVYEPNSRNKEMRVALANSGDGVDLDLVEQDGTYVLTFLSIKNGTVNISKNVKQMLEREGFSSSELYFKEDGSIVVNYV